MLCPTCGTDNLPGSETCKNCQLDLVLRRVADSAVQRSLLEDHVNVLPRKIPTTISPTSTVGSAIALMLASNVGALLVVDDAGKLVGIFSERDLLEKIAGVQERYADLPVAPFMTARPASVSAQATLGSVLKRMDAGGYRHVPVLDDGKPVSVISVRDMLCHITKLCQNGKDPRHR